MNKGAALEVLLKLRDEFSDQLKRAGGAVDGFQGKAAGGLGKVRDVAKTAAFALGGVALAAGAVAVTGIGAASDLQESMSKVNVVFGENADEIQDWAKGAARDLGQTRQQALEAAGTFGNLFDALELAPDATSKMSRGVVELATDLASFNNIGTDMALEKLRAGLVGEVEPLRTLGVNMNAAMVEAKAMEMGLVDANGELTEAAKVQARYALILEQTTNAQGDFARTAGGLANQKRILSAQVKDLQASLGLMLLPVVTLLVNFLNDKGIPALQAVVGWIEDFSEVVGASLSGDLATASAAFERLPGPLQKIALWLADAKENAEAWIAVFREDVLPVLQQVASAIGGVLGPALESLLGFLADHKDEVKIFAIGFVAGILVPAFIAWAVAAGAAAVATLLALAPIIAIGSAIGALAVVIFLLVKHWDTIRDATLDVWNTISDFLVEKLGFLRSIFEVHFQFYAMVAQFYWALISNYIETALNVIRDVIQIVMALVRGDWSEVWNGIKQLALDIWEGIKTDIVLKVEFIRDYLLLIWEYVRLTLEGIWNGLKDTAKEVWNGIRDNIVGPIETVIGWIDSLIEKINIIPDMPDITPGFDVPGVPGFATGIRGFRGGLAQVHKDELLYLPPRTDVYTAQESRRMIGETGAGGGRAPAGSQVVQHIVIHQQIVEHGVADEMRALGLQLAAGV